MLPRAFLDTLALLSLCAPIALARHGSSASLPGGGTEQESAEAGFSALLAPTADLSFFDRHNHTAGELPVHVHLTEELVTGQHCALVVLFLRALPDEEGAIEVRTEIEIERPDRTLYHRDPQRVVYAGPDIGEAVGLAGEYLVLSFDPGDPLGEYAVRARVLDVHGGVARMVEATLRHVELAEPEPFSDADEAQAWVGAYREHREAVRAVAAWRALASAGELEGEDGAPGEAFFRALLDDNPFLFPSLRAALADPDPRVQSGALRLLGTCRAEPELRLAGLDRAQRARCEAQPAAWDPDGGALEEAAQLDFLWATYLARGTYAPVERIVSALGRAGSEQAEILAGAARWSLVSMMEQDELVLAYARWALARGELEPRARAVLSELLEG